MGGRHLTVALRLAMLAGLVTVVSAACSGEGPTEAPPPEPVVRDDPLSVAPDDGSTTGGPSGEEVGASTAPAPAGEEMTDDERYQANIGTCMGEKGWEVSQDDQAGANVFDVPDEQTDTFLADHEACKVAFGYPVGAPSVTAAEAETLYAQFALTAECLRDEGFPVEEPPSRASFVEGLLANPIPSWTPYDAVVDDLRSFRDAEAACPQPGA